MRGWVYRCIFYEVSIVTQRGCTERVELRGVGDCGKKDKNKKTIEEGAEHYESIATSL